MKNTSILITGANVGLGKETARQLALKPETERIILACRNIIKAEAAKLDLEKSTGKSIFEILIIDVSNVNSVKKAVANLKIPIDAVVLNAGGMGGKTPDKITPSGMNELSATNVLGHVVLVEELLKSEKLKKSILFVSTEAVRGIKKMGMKRPALKSSTKNEFASILDGSYFGDNFDAMQAYGHVKYVATMWMSSLARKYSQIKFISISPGATTGTAAANDLPLINKIMFKYIMMPVVMPMMGMVHSLEKGASRFVNALEDESLESGKFYASYNEKVTGPIMDQGSIFPDLYNKSYQDNAAAAISQFVN